MLQTGRKNAVVWDVNSANFLKSANFFGTPCRLHCLPWKLPSEPQMP